VEGFRERFPRAGVSVVEGLTHYMLEWLVQGRIDAALVYNATPSTGVALQPVLEEPLQLISARGGGRPARAVPVSLAELAGCSTRFVHTVEAGKETLRLDKLRADPGRDALRLSELRPLEHRYLRRLAELKGASDTRLEEYRWLLEELRVSLFAQELRTPQPVSVKRLDKAWAQLSA
jgi:hypothetical protein